MYPDFLAFQREGPNAKPELVDLLSTMHMKRTSCFFGKQPSIRKRSTMSHAEALQSYTVSLEIVCDRRQAINPLLIAGKRTIANTRNLVTENPRPRLK